MFLLDRHSLHIIQNNTYNKITVFFQNNFNNTNYNKLTKINATPNRFWTTNPRIHQKRRHTWSASLLVEPFDVINQRQYRKNMASPAGERWRDSLKKHDIFKKLQERLYLEPQGTSKRIDKNLTFCLNSDLFIWDSVESVFYTTNLRHLNTEADINTSKYQVS